jgi:hypothetical protein
MRNSSEEQSEQTRAPGPKRDRAKVAFALSALALAFAYGTVVGVFHVFPYNQLRFMAGSVLVVREQLPTLTGVSPDEFLTPARVEGEGVTTFVVDRAAPGLTLLSGFFGDDSELRLIELDGTVIQRWPVRFHEIFRDSRHIQPDDDVPATNWNTDIHGAVALPDGSVLFNFEYGGLVKLDRCGEVVWTLPHMTHHSIEIAEDDSYFVNGRRYVEDSAQAISPLWRVPYHEDLILHVSSTGQVLDEISVPQLLLENGLLGLLTANGRFRVWLGGDLLHLNDVEPLSTSMAARFPGFAAGDLLISLRHINLVAVFDPATREMKWHQVGPWIRQHDPDFTSDGRLSIFNNNTDDTDRGTTSGGSSIVEVNPSTGDVRTIYAPDAVGDFFTRVRGKHQRLENGDILMAESLGGRAFEVTPVGEVVWQYINRYDAEHVARINDAIRYPDDYFTVSDWTCG